MWLLLFQWDSMAPLPTTNHLMSKVSGGKLVSYDDDIGKEKLQTHPYLFVWSTFLTLPPPDSLPASSLPMYGYPTISLWVPHPHHCWPSSPPSDHANPLPFNVISLLPHLASLSPDNGQKDSQLAKSGSFSLQTLYIPCLLSWFLTGGTFCRKRIVMFIHPVPPPTHAPCLVCLLSTKSGNCKTVKRAGEQKAGKIVESHNLS